MFCCTLPYVHSSIAIILMGKRELVALLNLSSWCLVVLERLFLAVPWGCLRFVIVVFPNHTHLLLLVFLFRYSFIRNIQLGHQLYMHCTILWPTKWYKMIKFHELFLMFCIFFQRQKLIFYAEILRFPVYKQYMYSQYYLSCLHHNILMKFMF